MDHYIIFTYDKETDKEKENDNINTYKKIRTNRVYKCQSLYNYNKLHVTHEEFEIKGIFTSTNFNGNLYSNSKVYPIQKYIVWEKLHINDICYGPIVECEL
jgi:hypothetical protein